jgi:hypothetical protein
MYLLSEKFISALNQERKAIYMRRMSVAVTVPRPFSFIALKAFSLARLTQAFTPTCSR